MAKYIVETYYTCSFKVKHYLDDISKNQLDNLDNRDDGEFEVLDVKFDKRNTKNLEKNTGKVDVKFNESIENLGKKDQSNPAKNVVLNNSFKEKIGGFGSLRHGQDIELSHRILNSGARVELLIDAVVYHRRRTTLKKFFRQVFNWGVARVNLGKIDNAMLEPIHFIPSVVTLLALFTVLGLALASNVSFLIIGFGVAGLLLVSLLGGIKNRSLIVIILLFLIVPIQIFGYGLGFMIAYFKRFILDHDEFTGFQKKYY